MRLTFPQTQLKMFLKSDITQIKNHGLSMESLDNQIKYFVEGFPFSNLVSSVKEGNGLIKFNSDGLNEAINSYDEAVQHKIKITKFVPASGAATRMFKNLYTFIDDYDGSDAAYNKLKQDTSQGSVYEFFKNIEKFAFYNDLKKVILDYGKSIEELHLKREYILILEFLLSNKGLNYGSLPKGLLKFHKENSKTKTPVEEHIIEGCQYAKDNSGMVTIHLTVSPEHQVKFEQHIAEVKSQHEAIFGMSINISFSHQQSSTDTIAVDLNNVPFRNSDGSLLFRPAGHGALLENLNSIDSDIVFIKNIDNVVPDRIKEDTIKYKKALAGLLLDIQKRVFDYLIQLEEKCSQTIITEIKEFIADNLGYKISDSESSEKLTEILNRPIRVCGMVKSEGNPGGGPFWVKDEKGTISLQIVETAQVNLLNQQQNKIFNQSTHFNPADLVCSLKNYRGKKFDLLKYRDPLAGFITKKSKDGKDLKAQELPGLWNGSMANWNTIFVEVPLITFNPVKSINDLLLKEHQ